MGHLALQGQ